MRLVTLCLGFSVFRSCRVSRPISIKTASSAGIRACGTIATPEHQRTHLQELQRIIAFLERSFVDQVSVGRLAEIAGISPAHFNRRFRQLLRLSPMQYVRSLRLHEAKRLLATTNQNIGQIAVAAGFYDQSYFTKRFRRATGMTPLAYRRHFRKHQQADQASPLSQCGLVLSENGD